MAGILYILLFWLLGNIISYSIDGYISGNILGMIMLFTALSLKIINPKKVEPCAKFLLKTMALFFVPYGVGLITSYQLIMENLHTILIASVASALLVLLIGGGVFQYLNKNRVCNK